MQLSKIATVTEKQLELACEFRYLVLLACFAFFADTYLIVTSGTGLIALRSTSLWSEFGSGRVVIFLGLFVFFMSFAVAVVQVILRFIAMLVPYKILDYFYKDEWQGVHPKDYFRIPQLKKYAVQNDNSTAYAYYKELLTNRKEELQLQYFCLALCTSIGIDLYAYTVNKSAIASWLFKIEEINSLTFPSICVTVMLWALLLMSLYVGVWYGCGFAISNIDMDKVYFKDNKFNDS